MSNALRCDQCKHYSSDTCEWLILNPCDPFLPETLHFCSLTCLGVWAGNEQRTNLRLPYKNCGVPHVHEFTRIPISCAEWYANEWIEVTSNSNSDVRVFTKREVPRG